MQFTGIRLIALPAPRVPLAAVTWKQNSESLRRKPFNGLHLSARLEAQAANACVPRRVQNFATLQEEQAKTQTPPIAPAPAPVVMTETVVEPAQTQARRTSLVALRQALLHLGVPVTRIAELTHTDRRSAHKHAHATPSSKVKGWTERSEAERERVLQVARELLA